MASMQEQLNSIDFNDVGAWPLWLKLVANIIVAVIVAVAGYYLHIVTMQEELDRTTNKEQGLRKTFVEKQAKAANLDAYRKQMEEMEETFGTMLRQLPSKTEVADLLVDITQKGLAAGLTFNTFKPTSEVPKEFYAELPIAIQVEGDYHNLGEFVSGVAALPRIVTLHDIAIITGSSDDTLKMSVMAKTYKYLDDK